MAYDSGESPEQRARRLAAEKSVSPNQLYGYGMTENEILEEIQRLELKDYETERDTTYTTDAEPWKAAKMASLGAIGTALGGLVLAPATAGMSIPISAALGASIGAGGGLAVDALTNVPIDMAGADANEKYLKGIADEKKAGLKKIGELKMMLARIRNRKDQRRALAAAFKNTDLG